MKQLFKRLICLFRGHPLEWVETLAYTMQCRRCGRTIEVKKDHTQAGKWIITKIIK